MNEYSAYLRAMAEQCTAEAGELNAAGCSDEAKFARIQANICEVCRTVYETYARVRPGELAEAYTKKLREFEEGWNNARKTALEHGDNERAFTEELKLNVVRAAAEKFAAYTEGAI